MKTKLLAMTALGLLVGPIAAEAVPIKYDVFYTATLGADGTGSFLYDDATKSLTSFAWDFQGQSGGLTDWHFSFDVLGDTRGSFLFELLTRTEAHSGADCFVAGWCSTGDSIDIGTGPLGANYLTFTGAFNDARVGYAFQDVSTKTVFAEGLVTVSSTAVPEPATWILFATGMAGLGMTARRARKRASAS